MYQITVENNLIGYAVTPDYIKKLDNGCYGLCRQEEATGVALNGTPYSLHGKTLDGLPVAEITETADNDFLNGVVETQKDAEELTTALGDAVEAIYNNDMEVIG